MTPSPQIKKHKKRQCQRYACMLVIRSSIQQFENGGLQFVNLLCLIERIRHINENSEHVADIEENKASG